MQKLKYHVLKTINYEKEEMIPLSEEENKSYEEQDVCYICKKKIYFDKNDENENNENNAKFKKYRKVKNYCHYIRKFRKAAHRNYNLKYKLPKNIQ